MNGLKFRIFLKVLKLSQFDREISVLDTSRRIDMNIVYLIEIEKESNPKKYIGSKSNCNIQNSQIISCRKKIYLGSSKNKMFTEDIKNYNYKISVLGNFETPIEALIFERKTHILYDVVANSEYYNLSIACENNFTNPEYALYKNIYTGKVARIKRGHQLVTSGEWVGITKGRVLSAEERKKRGRSGKLNGFFGKTHSDEIKKYLSELCQKTQKGRKKTEEHKNKISLAHKGKPKSKEHIEKMSQAQKLFWERKRNEDN